MVKERNKEPISRCMIHPDWKGELERTWKTFAVPLNCRKMEQDAVDKWGAYRRLSLSQSMREDFIVCRHCGGEGEWFQFECGWCHGSGYENFGNFGSGYENF